MKYQNNRTAQVKYATFISEDTVRKTVMLEDENGKAFTITTSTFKRWWKPVEEEQSEAQVEEQAQEEQKAEVVSDDTTDGGKTSLEQVGKEIAEQAKEKAKEAKKQKRVDRGVIALAIATMDSLKVEHRESWESKGTAMYIGKTRVFECWKRTERIRINYNPAITALDSKLCISQEQDKRSGSLSVTCYVSYDKIDEAIKCLVKNIAVEETVAKVSKSSKTSK